MGGVAGSALGQITTSASAEVAEREALQEGMRAEPAPNLEEAFAEIFPGV
jgi:hypothetical protein